MLVGDGEGVVTKIASAVAIKSDGVMLVPYHVVKDAKELQVRLKSGEIFDEVVLLGTDERRDIAAIKIQTAGLPVTISSDAPKAGDPTFFFTNTPGKLWSIAKGKLTAVRLADEVPGAGQGFRVIQFEVPIASGIDGGILVDANGNPAGVMTTELSSEAKAGFAVPISNVMPVGDAGKSRAFGSGRLLKLPVSEAAFRASKNPNDPLNLLLKSRTVYIETNTTLFKEQQLINELNKRKELKDWGWVLTTGSYEARNQADIIIELDHQILTFDFTFTVRHRKTSILLAAGKVIIADGASGAPKMADKIIQSVSAVINPAPAKHK